MSFYRSGLMWSFRRMLKLTVRQGFIRWESVNEGGGKVCLQFKSAAYVFPALQIHVKKCFCQFNSKYI